MISIFQSCLLPKMRLSVDLEGRYIGYKSPATVLSDQPCGTEAIQRSIGVVFASTFAIKIVEDLKQRNSMYISVLVLVLEVKITKIDAIWNDLSQHLHLHSSFEGLSNYLLTVILVIFFFKYVQNMSTVSFMKTLKLK